MAIVSFSNGFAFIKNLKTAGTSMEVHLSQQCADDDIVTPICPENHGHRPRNYLDSNGIGLFYNHMPATQIRDLIPDCFPSLYRFCFERHPVDKCLSHFAMLLNSPFHQKSGNPLTWEEYLERGDFPIDIDRYIDEEGKLLVSRVYKYEEISGALTDITAKTGIKNEPFLAFEKSGFRYDVPTFSEVMSRSTQRDLIFSMFESTLRFVDYSVT